MQAAAQHKCVDSTYKSITLIGGESGIRTHGPLWYGASDFQDRCYRPLSHLPNTYISVQSLTCNDSSFHGFKSDVYSPARQWRYVTAYLRCSIAVASWSCSRRNLYRVYLWIPYCQVPSMPLSACRFRNRTRMLGPTTFS